MTRGAQHVDICARTKDARFETGNDDCPDLWVLETKPLNRICEFDIDAEIVGVELQFIALTERHVFLNIHCQRRDRASHVEFPVFVLIW